MTPGQIAYAHDLILEAEVLELRRFRVAERMELLEAWTSWSGEEICEALMAIRKIELAPHTQSPSEGVSR